MVFKRNKLILASAGSGKTATIIAACKYLIESCNVDPFNIRPLIFNVGASKEVKQRLFAEIGDRANYIQTSTFHSWCIRLLSKRYKKQRKPLNVIKYQNVKEKLMKKVFFLFGLNQDDDITIKQAIANVAMWKNTNRTREFKDKLDLKCILKYEELKEKAKLIDHEDMLILFLDELNSDVTLMKRFQSNDEYVLIDEWQDVNLVMYELAKIYTEKSQKLFCVGDSKQSIYQWRGASSSIIDMFIRDRQPEIIEFNITYRNSEAILEIANRFSISRGHSKMIGLGHEGRSEVFECRNEQHEAEQLVKNIAVQLKQSKTSSIAVLTRINKLTVYTEAELMKNEIPYQVVGKSFFEKDVIQVILAYLNILSTPCETRNISNYRMVFNRPNRFISKAIMDKFETDSLAKGNCLVVLNGENKLSLFLSILKTLSTKDLTPYDAIVSVLNEFKLNEWIEKRNSLENGLMINVETAFVDYLLKMSMKFDTIPAFLNEIQRLSKVKDSMARVKLLTIHKSKGLEFTNVHLIGFVKGIMPNIMSKSIEEEENLFYVATTRARNDIFYYYYTSTLEGKQTKLSSFFYDFISNDD